MKRQRPCNRPPSVSLPITGCLVALLASSAATAASGTYADFPVTVPGYTGDAEHSESYALQAARHLLHESLKKLAGQGNGSPDPDLEARMLDYYAESTEGRPVVEPASSGAFVFLQSGIDEMSGGRNLSGSTYPGTVTAWPGNRTGDEVLRFWIAKAAAADGGTDLANGYDYPQLISKFVMGAVFYNQIADKYLDENLETGTKPNDQPYSEGAAYTGKEHSWDEAFGYFGAAANAGLLSAEENHTVATRGSRSGPAAALVLADHNGDGKVDYYKEMTYALAYYAASYDVGGKTDYLHTIFQAFLDGRLLLVQAAGKALDTNELSRLHAYADVIKGNLQSVIAESVFKYAGETYEDLQKLQVIVDTGGDPDKAMRDYTKHWSELKGFSMALQLGGRDLGETAVRLNRLIGYGPALPNSSQVIDVDSAGNYIKDQSPGLGEYSLHMLKVQKLVAEQFEITARSHDQLSDLADLTEMLGGGGAAEND